MVGILADHNCEGYLRIIFGHYLAGTWRQLWLSLGYRSESFATLGLSPAARDARVWQLCQANDLVLITGNRNRRGTDSLTATIQKLGTPASLPVITLAKPKRLSTDRAYLIRVADQLMVYLFDIEGLRGTGRLYVP